MSSTSLDKRMMWCDSCFSAKSQCNWKVALIPLHWNIFKNLPLAWNLSANSHPAHCGTLQAIKPGWWVPVRSLCPGHRGWCNSVVALLHPRLLPLAPTFRKFGGWVAEVGAPKLTSWCQKIHCFSSIRLCMCLLTYNITSIFPVSS